MEMPVSDSSELAVDAINKIYDQWMVDPDCSLWVGDTSPGTILHEGFGFNWWPGDFKVEVRVTGPRPELAQEPIYRLTVRTDFLRDADHREIPTDRLAPESRRLYVCDLCSSYK
jgi:hypothetical protein